MKKIVMAGETPGVLAFIGSEPIGWCSVAPREVFVRLERSHTLKPVDDQQVWSIACLFIAKPFRAQGVSVELLKAAVSYVKKKGGRIVEGYPVEPDKKWPDAFAWTGVTSAYVKAGFEEVLRRAPSRPIMRCYL
jgi:GNAT superfamily N-acetyltransferase